jgi:hypothetical protein
MKYCRRFIGMRLFVLATVLLTTGCSSVMQKSTIVNHVDGNMSMVNFVRPHIFLGDGVDYDLWDGDKFIGVLGSGTIVQYKTSPGAHVFMSKGRYWAYVKADLAGGKQYFIKLHVLPFGGLVLSAIDGKKITDVNAWYDYHPEELMAEKGENYAAGKKTDAEDALKAFRDGHADGFDLRPENGI